MRDRNFGYPNGTPVENPLITDPVRQQFVWKYFAIEELKQGRWPLWNPYNFSGTPHLANFQTGVFYPLNIIFFLPAINQNDPLQHFATLWSYFIYAQIPLSIFFLYLYLRKIGLSDVASLFGGGVWALSGFSAAWWEWGNVVHTLLYFPLILWCIENLIERDPVKIVGTNAIEKPLYHPLITLNRYKLIMLFALLSSFFAGHLQTFFLVAINTLFYVLYKIPLFAFKKVKFSAEHTRRRLYYWLQLGQVAVLFGLIAMVQLLPTLEFVGRSARNIDTTTWQRKDWFFPIEHFVGFIAPDFFGNPSTYNYWGVWNYGEFAAYIGIIPLIFALMVVIQYVYDQITKIFPKSADTLDIVQENAGVGFFLVAFFINLVLITRNPLTHYIYAIHIPFLTTTQPSRGIALVVFALVILSAVGFHKTFRFLKTKTSITSFTRTKTNIRSAYLLILISFTFLWYTVLTKQTLLNNVMDNSPAFDVFRVARNNLILPSLFTVVAIITIYLYFQALQKGYLKKNDYIKVKLPYLLIGVMLTFTVLDLGRFFLKFQAFSKREFLYPQIPILQTLQDTKGAKYMTDDSRIMAPNMNIGYKLKTIEGYDPLYLNNYGKLIGLWQRNEPSLAPFPANRILTPHNPNSVIADISATNYLLTFNDQQNMQKIGEYGLTKLYQRPTAIPRVTIFSSIRGFETEQSLVNYMFSRAFDPSGEALFIVKPNQTNANPAIPQIKIPDNGLSNSLGVRNFTVELVTETPTQLKIKANLQDSGGLLYVADTFEEGWKAFVNGKETNIIKTNFAFRGIILPQGNHDVELRYEPESFRNGLYITLFGLLVLSGISIRSWKGKYGRKTG